MSKPFNYNTDFEYWTTDGISQIQGAYYMMALPTVYPELLIWINMFTELLACQWMFIGLIRATVTPYEIKTCLDTATVEKFGQED
jgi:hypothetical protein